MQTVNFNCVHCGNLMAVGMNLLGRSVRCPHCKQILTAPQSPGAPATIPGQAPAPAPVMPAAAPQPAPVPQFAANFSVPKPNDGQDSIFGEPMEDDLFGGKKPVAPVIPPQMFNPPPPPPDPWSAPPQQQATMSAPPGSLPGFGGAPAPYEAPAYAPPGGNSWAAQAPAPAPELAAYVAPGGNPWAAQAPAPSAYGAPHSTFPAAPQSLPGYTAPGGNPWGAGAPASAPAPTEPMPTQGRDRLVKARNVPTGGGNTGIAWTIVAILVPYAILITIVAATLFLVKPTHPLEVFPDDGNQGRPSKVGAGTSTTLKRPEVDKPLPDSLRVDLGNTLTIGKLEVTPLRVEQKRIKGFQKNIGADVTSQESTSEGLLLYLRVKNISEDEQFCPTDPAFNRRWEPADARGNVRDSPAMRPFTAIEMGKKNDWIWGGPFKLKQLTGKDDSIERQYVEGQEKDHIPLKPGEERETTICSPTNQAYAAAVASVSRYSGPLLWRVHLRRGLLNFNGRNVSTTAVIGVKFKAGDIKRTAGKG